MGNAYTTAMKNLDIEKAHYCAQALIEQSITLVCFAQYSCFIHFDNAHIRIESSASVGDMENRYSLFPIVNHNSLSAILGKKVIDVQIDVDNFRLILGDSQTINVEIQDNFESLGIVTDNSSAMF